MRTIGTLWLICASVVGILATTAATALDSGTDPLESLPKINFREYKVGPYIDAAGALQALGKDKACEWLRAHGNDHELYRGDFVLLRMLFVKKADGQFRRPLIGGAMFLGGTDYKDWPLEPIELVDGVPFLITRGYRLGGSPETVEKYLDYCLKNCEWNDFQFKKRDDKQLQAALEKILSSEKWNKPLDDGLKEFFAAQIR